MSRQHEVPSDFNFGVKRGGIGFSPKQHFQLMDTANFPPSQHRQHFSHASPESSRNRVTQYQFVENQQVSNTPSPPLGLANEVGWDRRGVSYPPYATPTCAQMPSSNNNIPMNIKMWAGNQQLPNGGQSNGLGLLNASFVPKAPVQAQLGNLQQYRTVNTIKEVSSGQLDTFSTNRCDTHATLPFTNGEERKNATPTSNPSADRQGFLSPYNPPLKLIPSNDAHTRAQFPLVESLQHVDEHSLFTTSPIALPRLITPPDLDASSKKRGNEFSTPSPLCVPTSNDQRYSNSQCRVPAVLQDGNLMTMATQPRNAAENQNYRVVAKISCSSSASRLQQDAWIRAPAHKLGNSNNMAPTMQRSTSTSAQKYHTAVSSPSPSPSPMSSDTWKELPASNMPKSTENPVTPSTQRCSLTHERILPTPAKPLLPRVSSGLLQQNLMPSLSATLARGINMTAPAQQRLSSTNSQKGNTPKSPLSAPFLSGGEKPTNQHQVMPIVNIASCTSATSLQSHSSSYHNALGQKRRAENTYNCDVQVKKRQATETSNSQRDANLYQASSARQQLCASKSSRADTAVMLKTQGSLLIKQQAYQNELREQQLLAEAERMEHQRQSKRKKEIIKDPSALYRHYHEFLRYYPLSKGERKNRYFANLLANQFMPMEEHSDLGLAIKYAKEHWDTYLEYPRDVAMTARMVRAKLEKEKEAKSKSERVWIDKKSGRARR